MWRFLFIAFFIVHAAIHAAIWIPTFVSPKGSREGPQFAGRSWLLGEQKGLALALALLASGFLLVAGIGLWGHAEWWRMIAVIGLAVSFVLMVLYFHPWFLLIQAVNAALLVSILWLDWPTKSMVGA